MNVKMIGLYIFIIISALIILLPFAWMISTSFRPDNELFRYPPSLTAGEFTLDNYPRLFEESLFPRYYFNSILVTVIASLGALFTSSLAGFAFAKYRFPGGDILFYIVLSTIMIPIFTIIIPLYLIMRTLGWIDTYWALIVPFIASPFGIFLMRQFLGQLPDELIAAARIDGCSEFRIYYQIILPLSKPILGTLFILLFMANWDQLLWPSIIINTRKMWTLPIGLIALSRQVSIYASSGWNFIMVGIFLVILPVLIAYIFLQKYFVRSIVLSGLK